MTPSARVPRRLRLGMVGGGPGSNIGDTHRRASRYDDRYQLVAGVFSTDAARSRAFATGLGITEDRRYGSWQEMADAEAARADGIEVVSVCTPNDSHHAVSRAFLARGIDVVCDKPLTTTVPDAIDLVRFRRDTGLILAVTYNYSGYAMVRHARDLVRGGGLGEVRLVQVEFASGWAATLLEEQGHKQAAWRTDTAVAGASSVVADIGTHAHHLARFITGLEIDEVSAELATLVRGRQVDDNAHVKLRFVGGARGLLWASMAAAGQLHGLRIRVYGDHASLEWVQERPDELVVRETDGSSRTLARGAPGLSPTAERSSRLWAGHPEGFVAAFANVYRDIADAVVARREGAPVDPSTALFPTVEDGALGVRFVEAVVDSHERGGAWVSTRTSFG